MASFALSLVLHCHVFSMYSDIGSYLYLTTLNRLAQPIEDRNPNLLCAVLKSCIVLKTKRMKLLTRSNSNQMFEYHGHIHVYSPGAGADNPLGPKYFHKHKFSVYLLIPSKFTAIK